MLPCRQEEIEVTEDHNNTRALRRETVFITGGMAAFVASIQLYSPAILPFQRLPGTTAFVGSFAQILLACTFVLALIVALLAFRGRRIPDAVARPTGALLYVIGSASFIASSVFDALPSNAIAFTCIATALTCSLGSVLLCLTWGRILKRLSFSRALITAASAAVICAAIHAFEYYAPVEIALGAFAACVIAAALLPYALRSHQATSQPAFSEHLPSLAHVTAAPALGLALCAFITGSMRTVFMEMYDTYIVGTLIAAAIVISCVLLTRNAPLIRVLYQRVIPLIAVSTLSIFSITLAVLGGSVLNAVMTMLLYMFVAILTLGIICAIAHAGEFPSDSVFLLALSLFALASFLGVRAGEMIADSDMNTLAIVVTALYAITTVQSQGVFNKADAEPDAQPEHGQDPNHDLPDAHKASEEHIDAIAQAHNLTRRETEILHYLAKGHTGAYVAKVLFISPNTARTHIHNIYRKLNVSSREEILHLTR